MIAGRNMVDGMLEVREWVKEFGLKDYDKDAHDGLLRHLMVREPFATGEMKLALFATKMPDGELAGIEIVETSIESAKRIVYVSCNPDTFATDVIELLPFGATRFKPCNLSTCSRIPNI